MMHAPGRRKSENSFELHPAFVHHIYGRSMLSHPSIPRGSSARDGGHGSKQPMLRPKRLPDGEDARGIERPDDGDNRALLSWRLRRGQGPE